MVQVNSVSDLAKIAFKAVGTIFISRAVAIVFSQNMTFQQQAAVESSALPHDRNSASRGSSRVVGGVASASSDSIKASAVRLLQDGDADSDESHSSGRQSPNRKSQRTLDYWKNFASDLVSIHQTSYPSRVKAFVVNAIVGIASLAMGGASPLALSTKVWDWIQAKS